MSLLTGYTLLWHAIPSKIKKIIETLVQAGASPEGAPIFQKTLQEGTTEILQLFLSNSKTRSYINCVDQDGQTPITVAVLQGRRDCVKLLIDNGADLGYTLPSKDTVINLIFEHLPRPADFIEELLDSRATVTGSGKKFLVNLGKLKTKFEQFKSIESTHRLCNCIVTIIYFSIQRSKE